MAKFTQNCIPSTLLHSHKFHHEMNLVDFTPHAAGGMYFTLLMLEFFNFPRFHVLVPGPIATPQRRVSHPGEDPSKLRSPEEAARAFVRLLGSAEGAASGGTLTL